MYALSRFAMYRTVSHPTSREAIWFASDTAACQLKHKFGGLEQHFEVKHPLKKLAVDAAIHYRQIDGAIRKAMRVLRPHLQIFW
jgi:hypothetical protein